MFRRILARWSGVLIVTAFAFNSTSAVFRWPPVISRLKVKSGRSRCSFADVVNVIPPSVFDADTPNHPKIAEHARRSVGGAIKAMQLARQGKAAFSLLRPPGHHARRDAGA